MIRPTDWSTSSNTTPSIWYLACAVDIDSSWWSHACVRDQRIEKAKGQSAANLMETREWAIRPFLLYASDGARQCEAEEHSVNRRHAEELKELSEVLAEKSSSCGPRDG